MVGWQQSGMLIRAAGDEHPAGTSCFAAGGMGAVTQAMVSATQQAGAEIRSGVEVIEIRVRRSCDRHRTFDRGRD